MVLCSTLSAFLLFLASAASFPRDLTPLSTVSEAATAQYPYFCGLAEKNDTAQLGLDFQSMLRVNQTLFIAARDHIYAFDLRQTKDSFSPKRHITWETQDMENCALRGKLRDECYNYIKVLVPKNDQILLACGTNAFNPVCRTYRIGTFEQEGEELNGQARCPFDVKQNNVAIFVEGNLYSATVADFQASDAVIYRSLGERSPVLRTVKYDSKWLREPHFIHTLDYGEYIYFFFHEISIEYTTLGRVVFSRVGRVCKNDMGGSPRVLEKYWTSFLKARLNCSVPGDSFFYFDVLQAVTDVVHMNGQPIVFGVFTTQSNSITGSAVCAFYMDEVERVFGQKFKEQKTADAGWTPISEDKVPSPRPGSCAGIGKASGYRTSNEFPDDMLSFIKSFPLLDEAVPSVGEQPWFTKTSSRYKLTRLVADTSAGPFQNQSVLFLGSEDGTVLKVLSHVSGNGTVETVLLEELLVYRPSRCSKKCDDRRVLALELDKANHALYVAFSGCMVLVPLSRCGSYGTCRRSCLASRDPYCIWLPTGTCATASQETRSGFEQDVENAAKDRNICPDVLMSAGEQSGISDSAYGVRQEAEGKDGARSVHFTFLIGCVFMAFALGAILSGLLVSCYCNHGFQKTARPGKDPESGMQRPLSLRSLAKMNALLESQAKEGLRETATAQLYTALLPGEKKLPRAAAKAAGAREPPELAGLPTPESTPELPAKRADLKAIRNRWQKTQNFNDAKEAPEKAFRPPLASAPAFLFPARLHSYEAAAAGGGYLNEKIPNSERLLLQPLPPPGCLPKGVEVAALQELLQHLRKSGGAPRKELLAGLSSCCAPATAFANRVQPKIPNLESASYYSSSTLPRDSLPRRLDVPPEAPPPAGPEQSARPSTKRHSLCAAPKLVNVGGGLLFRHPSLGPAGRTPPALLTRVHSTGSSMPQEGPPGALLTRQHSYGGVPLPNYGGLKRSVSLIKPGPATKPFFQPSSPPAGSLGPFNY